MCKVQWEYQIEQFISHWHAGPRPPREVPPTLSLEGEQWEFLLVRKGSEGFGEGTGDEKSWRLEDAVMVRLLEQG